MNSRVAILITLLFMIFGGFPLEAGIELRRDVWSGAEQEASATNDPDVSLRYNPSRGIRWRDVRSKFPFRSRHALGSELERFCSAAFIKENSFPLASQHEIYTLHSVYRL
jgi:hypothetical protein